MHTHQSLIPLLQHGCKCMPHSHPPAPLTLKRTEHNRKMCICVWSWETEKREFAFSWNIILYLYLNSYRYHISLFFRLSVCVFVCVSLCDRCKGAAGTVYFQTAVPQKEVFITVPECTESRAVMISNRLSAVYMKMWLVEKRKIRWVFTMLPYPSNHSGNTHVDLHTQKIEMELHKYTHMFV